MHSRANLAFLQLLCENCLYISYKFARLVGIDKYERGDELSHNFKISEWIKKKIQDKETYSWVGCGVSGAGIFWWTGWFAFALLTLESDADRDRLSSPPEWLDLLELIDLVVEPLLLGFRGAWLGLLKFKQNPIVKSVN